MLAMGALWSFEFYLTRGKGGSIYSILMFLAYLDRSQKAN